MLRTGSRPNQTSLVRKPSVCSSKHQLVCKLSSLGNRTPQQIKVLLPHLKAIFRKDPEKVLAALEARVSLNGSWFWTLSVLVGSTAEPVSSDGLRTRGRRRTQGGERTARLSSCCLWCCWGGGVSTEQLLDRGVQSASVCV